MRYLVGLVASVSLVAVSPVLAEDPPATPTAAPAPSPPAPAELATPSAPLAAASGEAEAKAKADALAVDKRMRGRGYKPVVKNGVTRYCRNETVVGSRFPVAVCGTPDELDAAALRGQETTERMQRDVIQRQSN